jgi:GAF domain-containing protein
MPNATTDIPTTEPLAGLLSSAAALLGTAAVIARADGRERGPITAVGEFYRVLAGYPAGAEHLMKVAGEAASAAADRGRAASVRRDGLAAVAFPVNDGAASALVVFTTAGPNRGAAALLAAELGIPHDALPGAGPPLDHALVVTALRFLEQAMAYATGGSHPAKGADMETRRYRILYAAAQSLSRARGDQEVLRCAAESLAGILHMDHAAPYLPASGRWTPREGVSYWGEPYTPSEPLELTEEQEQALGAGRMLALTDGERSHRRRLLVPVMFESGARREMVAVMELEAVSAPRAPLSIEEDFALLVARQTGLALRAARDAAVQNTLARKLQETLQSHSDHDALPRMNVQEFYRPAAQDARVGGDFYDVFALPDGRGVVLVGDVAGKGLDSAIHTTLARYTLRAYAMMTPDPAEILRLTNEALARFREFKDFLTLALVVLDPEAGRLTYASAGHCPIFLYRKSADAIGSLESTGTLLGMMPGVAWASRTHKWEEGDALLLYTDGISEAHPPGDFELFETTRIRDIFAALRHAPPEEIVNAVFQAAHDFSQGVMHDDCAMLLLTNREPG